MYGLPGMVKSKVIELLYPIEFPNICLLDWTFFEELVFKGDFVVVQKHFFSGGSSAPSYSKYIVTGTQRKYSSTTFMRSIIVHY